MKNIIGLLIFLISCQSKQENKTVERSIDTRQHQQIKKQDSLYGVDLKQENKTVENSLNPRQYQQIGKLDSLFVLDLKLKENIVRIIKPKKSDFKFPDSLAKIKPIKFGDFNADNKEDILVNLGACGTGGCMCGLFLKQYDNYYKLAFMGYLKNPEFKVEKNGLWTIESSEEIEPYNPSKLQMSIFKLDKSKYQYKLDTTFVYYDK